MRVTQSILNLQVLTLSLCLAVNAIGKDVKSDTTRIQTLTGLKGMWNAKENLFKVTSPRNDVPVTVDGFEMLPFMGLTSWASFTDGGKAEMIAFHALPPASEKLLRK
jgi:hypothetical protein